MSIRDPFTEEEKDQMIGFNLYHQAFITWFKGDLIALNDQERYMVAHGRSLRQDRSIRLPASLFENVVANCQEAIPGLPAFEKENPNNNLTYTKVHCDFVVDEAKLDEDNFDIVGTIAAAIISQLPAYLDDVVSIKNRIYVAREYRDTKRPQPTNIGITVYLDVGRIINKD